MWCPQTTINIRQRVCVGQWGAFTKAEPELLTLNIKTACYRFAIWIWQISCNLLQFLNLLLTWMEADVSFWTSVVCSLHLCIPLFLLELLTHSHKQFQLYSRNRLILFEPHVSCDAFVDIWKLESIKMWDTDSVHTHTTVPIGKLSYTDNRKKNLAW